jgi:hypothetical protein
MEYKFKSEEEQQFADWLTEAELNGLVLHWEYEPKTFDLIPARKYIEIVQTKTKTNRTFSGHLLKSNLKKHFFQSVI